MQLKWDFCTINILSKKIIMHLPIDIIVLRIKLQVSWTFISMQGIIKNFLCKISKISKVIVWKSIVLKISLWIPVKTYKFFFFGVSLGCSKDTLITSAIFHRIMLYIYRSSQDERQANVLLDIYTRAEKNYFLEAWRLK